MAPLGKAALDTGKLCMAGGFASKIADEAEATEKPEEPAAPGKQSEWRSRHGWGAGGEEEGGPPGPWGVHLHRGRIGARPATTRPSPAPQTMCVRVQVCVHVLVCMYVLCVDAHVSGGVHVCVCVFCVHVYALDVCIW